MGKYRIIRRRQGRAEIYGGDEYWQKDRHNYAEDLDLEELWELNNLPETNPKGLPPLAKGALAALTLLAFFGLIALDLVPFLHPPDLRFLDRSAQLAQDEALLSLKSAVVSIEGAYASGSGFNLRAEGLIVTNRHVVENSGPIAVVFPDGDRYLARKWQFVEGYDLALAHINGVDLPHVELAEEIPLPGDELIFIGNPLGFDWTISEAQMLQTLDYQGDSVLYFAGPVRSGSSGSPLFNGNGQVTGVIFASLRGVEDSGLAIPALLLLSYLQ